MHPFAVFFIILVVIWVISGLATAMNKQKEQERRRRMRAQLERATMGQGSPFGSESRGQMMPPPVAPPAPRRISEGIADRFPDVLLPPQPVPQRPRATPQRPALPPRPIQPRQAARQQSMKQPKRRVVSAAPALEFDRTVLAAPPPPPPIASAPPPAARPAARGVAAPAISRWLVPGTLRQQFILTEVLQPPVALRDNRHP